MKRNALIPVVLVAGLAGLPASALAQRVTDEHVQELIRAAANSVGAQAGAPVAAGAQQQAADATPRPAVQLTLEDAVKLALDRNLDIAVQRLNPSTYDYTYANLAAAYRPSLTSQVGRQSITNPSTQTISGGSAGSGINNDTATFNGGIAQNVKWGGGAFAVALNNNRLATTSSNSLFNPSFNTNWSAQYTQPLLRNFKIDSNRQQLVVTRLNQDISEIQLQASIINTVSNVRNAYWDLVYATQAVEVAQRSVDLAEQLVKDNQTRVEIGTMAPIDVVQAQSQAATQRQNLAVAEGTKRTNELALKRLIVNGTQDPNWSANLVAADQPEFAPTPIDIEAAVKRGLENRTDLQQARKNLQVNDVTLKYLNNQTLPQADMVARYGLAGLGGEQFTGCTGNGVNRQCAGTISGNYTDSLSSLLRQSYPTWSFQLNVTYPLGTSAQEATVARARVQENQVQAQLKQIELQIATDITNAATSVQNNVERVDAAKAARELAQRTLEAEQSKFEVGMSTNYFVVQAQRDLLTAAINELQSVLAYRKALVELERLQQTSLTTSNITILGR